MLVVGGKNLTSTSYRSGGGEEKVREGSSGWWVGVFLLKWHQFDSDCQKTAN